MDASDLLPTDDRFFTRAEAIGLGATDRSLRAGVRAGVLVRLRQGAYARRDFVDGLEREERHLLLARAVLAQQRGEVALAGPSAALSRGFDVFGHDLDVVHLMRLDGGAGRREAGVVHHRASAGTRRRVTADDGVLAVSPEDAAWQAALVTTLEGGVVTFDSALRTDPELAARLAALAAGCQQVAHSRTARIALRLARPKAESVGESLTRVACYRYGIPAPELQHVVLDHGLFLGRSDFWWPEARLLGEFDGKIKYGRLRKPGTSAVDVVVDEKTREDAMRSTGCGMSRFVWHEVQPDVAGRRMGKLRHELDQSRRLYVRVGA